MAGNYTWTGNTSSAWSVSSNWSPSGVPGTNDTVTIGSGSDTIVLASNRTISRLVINGRTLNLGDYELEVSQKATLSGGKIYNGTLKLRGALATFSGTHTDCQIDCIAGQLEFNGGVFDGEGSFEQNGSAGGNGSGGCVFNAPITIKKSTNALLRLGTAIPDTFNSRVEFICVNKVPLEISYGSASVFNDIVSVSCYGANSEITIGNDTDTVQFNGDAALATGSEGLTDGVVILKRISQSGRGDNELSGDEEFVIHIESCTFNGGMTLTAPSILLKNSVFWGDVTLTKIRAASNNYSYGGNSFHGRATLENQDGTYAFRLANNAGDHFYNDVVFASSSNRIQMAYSGNNYFEGNISINSSDIKFNTSSGKVVLTGDKNQTLEGTDPYLLGKLEINKTAGTVQLDQQMTIDSAITFVNGIINTDSVITLKAATTCTGASNLSFADGPVKKIGNTAFVFPVGDEGYFYPAGISSPGTASDAFQCQYFSENSGLSENSDSTITSISQCQFWKIERKAGSSTVSVTLNWDSLGCGVLDTSGLIVANWNGSKWKDMGRNSISGNAYNGSITNHHSVYEYSYFTLASVASVITLSPTLDNAKTRSMPEDFFGYNGNNTIKSDDSGVNLQNWEMMRDHDANSANDKKYLLDKYITLMRIPAGTVSNYSDWRTGYPIYEKDLPNGWKYRQNAYSLPMNREGNELQFVSDNLTKIAARPIIAMNLLSSRYYYELASLYRLNEVNLPVKYIELGNEFYLSNDQYFEEFAGVDNYMDKAIEWADGIKSISAFENTKIAVVGATAEDGSSGRQRLWLDQVLARLKNNTSVDAITLHNYIRNSPSGTSCIGSLANAGLESFLRSAFENAYELQHDELIKIRLYNLQDIHDKEVWFTEFNLDDDRDVRTGTWAHGLLNAISALKYLESQDVTKVISHTMLAGAKYGNIFENDDAFRFIQCHGLPTVANPNQAGIIPTGPIEKSALGTALDAVAYITRGAISATPIAFNGANQLDLSNFVELYGWEFEDEYGNKNCIFINAGSNNYFLNLSNIYSTVNASLFNAKGISAYNNSCVITNDPVSSLPSSNSSQFLHYSYSPWKFAASHLLAVPAFSLVVLKPINPNGTVTARLSDDAICEGTSAVLTIEGTGTISPTATNATLVQIDQVNDRYIYSVTPTSTGTITITPCSSCSTLQLEVYPKITNFTVSGSTTYCPGDNAIKLEASFSAGAGGSNSLSYSFLWAPDSGVVSGTTCGNSPLCKDLWVEPNRTTIYTAYITDGHCWASQNHTVTVPINEFNLGSDIQFCSGTTASITLGSTYIDPDPNTTPTTYQWSAGTQSGTSTILTPTTTVSVTLSITDEGCTVSDVITLQPINCCSGAAGDPVASPSIHNFPNKTSNEYYITATAVAAACSTAGGYVYTYLDNGGIPTSNPLKMVNLEIDGSSVSSKSIYINGELRIQDDYYDDPSHPTPDINGMGLILKNCNVKFAENAGINIEYGKLTMENCTLQACSTFMWKGIYAPGLGPKDPLPAEITGCIIKDAVQAFDLKNDVPFTFTNNNFENNHSDVLLTNYFGTIPSDVFIGNLFKATSLLTPYSGQHKFAAIELVNVKNITIGEDVSGSENEFSNSLYGIKSHNSSFKLLNNSFKDIGDFANVAIPGTCVMATSESDFSDREITLGNGSNAGENIFESSTNGVVVDGESHFYVKNNVFGNSTSYSDKIRDYCIKAENTGKMNLEIKSINSFYDYKYGIWLTNSKPYNSFLINNNDFYNFDANITSTANYEGTAITVLQPFLTTVPGAEISENNIGRYNTDLSTPIQTQPRNGIVVSLMKNIKVSENAVKFKINTASPAFNHHGIWLQQCDYARLYDNEVTNTVSNFPDQIKEHLIGFEMNDCNNTCIEGSVINKMGFGMRFTGVSNVRSLYTNEINNYDTAYFIDNSFIGTSVGRNSPPIVMNNIWTRTGSSLTSGRVDGSVQGGGIIDWYYQSSSGGEFIPTGPIVVQNLLSTYTAKSLCPPSTRYIDFDDPPYTSNLRNTNYGPVVGDTARYPEEYESNFRALARSALYLTLKRNPEILRMDDPADDAFVEFYNNMSGQNVQLFDSVMTLIQEEKYDEADALNESIEETNDIDETLKISLRMFLKTTQPDNYLSTSDTSELLEIAYLNPLHFGAGVYIARNLLYLEIYDENSGSYRLMNTRKEFNSFDVIIHPNPGTDYISIACSDGRSPDMIIIKTLEGKILELSTANSIVDISSLSQGIYLCTVFKEGKTKIKKIVKL